MLLRLCAIAIIVCCFGDYAEAKRIPINLWYLSSTEQQGGVSKEDGLACFNSCMQIWSEYFHVPLKLRKVRTLRNDPRDLHSYERFSNFKTFFAIARRVKRAGIRATRDANIVIAPPIEMNGQLYTAGMSDLGSFSQRQSTSVVHLYPLQGKHTLQSCGAEICHELAHAINVKHDEKSANVMHPHVGAYATFELGFTSKSIREQKKYIRKIRTLRRSY